MAATSFFDSLSIQRRVIHALLLRELITRFGRQGLGALWLVGEPMLFTLIVATIWYTVRLDGYSDVPIFAFCITGWSALLLWRNAANRGCKAVQANVTLLYHKNVRVIDIYLSRMILEVLGACFSFTILVLLFSAAEILPAPYDIGSMLCAWLMLCWFALALGLTVGELADRSETFERIWRVSSYLLMISSGTFFMVHWLPSAVQEIVLWIPMVHGVEWLRHGYFGDLIPTYESPAYLATVNLILTFIGLSLVKTSRHRT